MSDIAKFMTDGTEPFGSAKSSYYAAFRDPRERDKVELSIIAKKTSEIKSRYGDVENRARRYTLPYVIIVPRPN